jgi:hypothetical protein
LRNRYRPPPYRNFRNSSGPFSASTASPAWRRRLSPGHAATPQDDVRIAIQRSQGLLSDTAQLFDALDARSNFEPIMQSVRDLNKLDDA